MILIGYLYLLLQLALPLGLDLYMPVPEENPLTAEKVQLGRQLFSESRLSRTGEISCQTCHQPALGFTDGNTVAKGVMGRTGRRNVPAIINRGYGSAYFWDGRARSLEQQVLKPIQDPNEMDMPLDELVGRLQHDRTYAKLFRQTFGHDVLAEDVAKALASYVRTILSGDSPMDRFISGDVTALTETARRGLQIFRGKGNCVACHLGPDFSDERFSQFS